MSHHGPNPFDKDEGRRFEELKRAMMDTSSFRGAIGAFPQGKLTKQDEGSIQFAIGEKDGKVVLDFGTPVAWIGMTPQEACDIASALFRRSREVGRKNGEIVCVNLG